jgi:arginyl-tRNA synthetase
MNTDSNLFDYFDDAAGEDGGRARWALRAPYRPQGRFDLMLVPLVKGWDRDRAALGDLERIEREPWVEAVDRGGDQIRIRLVDAWIEQRGAALEERAGGAVDYDDLAGGRRFALNFWDANSTKALHIGHLRNISLGNALGSSLAQAGGRVEQRSIICDVGRSMGEAMAGVVRSGRYEQMAAEGNGVKSDHFVGYCYADYVKNGGSPSALAADHPADSLTREVDVQNDSADQLLQRVLNGDQAALELWSQTRAWVISGQRKTLARLGISFDRVFFESDFLPEVVELTERGLREGTLRRRGDGAVVYMTGREELEEMPLVRSDGVPTQHMRALAYWLAAPGLDGTTSIQICGQEWVAHVTCRRQLMAELARSEPQGDDFHPAHDVFHGMVAKERQKIASSKKDALLIDHLIEWIDEQVDRDPAAAAVRDAHPAPERIASQVALGFFPLHPANRKVEFEPEKLLVDDKSLGWDMARARAQRSPEQGSPNGGRVADRDYRFAVVQAEMYRRNLSLATERLDPIPLARYASHLSRWQLERRRGPHVDRVVGAALDDCARGLGLEGQR